MKLIRKITLALALVCTSVATFAQFATDYSIKPYLPNDGGILTKLSPNGEWGIIVLGSSQNGGTATPKIFDMETGEAFEVKYGNYVFGVSDVSDDGNIVVGSLSGRPAAYNRSSNKVTIFPLRNLWQSGNLSNVTPDGKWAVGSYNGYTGQIDDEDELNHDYYYSTLFVNVETGDTIYTPGLPQRDMAHLDQHAMVFDDITPDGRYLVGRMSWYIIQPNSGFTFIYDTQQHTYKVIGFTEHANRDWEPEKENLYNLCDGSLSPDGHWLAGMAYMTFPQENSDFPRELGVPYRYDLRSGKLEIFDQEDVNIEGCVIDNAGTIIANPNNGSPLRDFRIFYMDRYWINLSQICKQYYGFNFREKTGFERTGSIVGISGDGSRIVSFVDPLGESYAFDFQKPIEDICSQIDLLDNYTISPVDGSVFALLSSVEINFGRAVQVLGTGRNVHLYKADGTKVADGLTAGNQGLQLKAGSTTTVSAVFRTRELAEGEKYYVTIDAGAIAIADDAERVNKEIRVNYVGRRSGPVSFVDAIPQAHSQLRQFDATSYILLSFDSPVQQTDQAKAYVQRVEDNAIVGDLTLVDGSSDSTRNKLLLYPASTIYLYDSLEYKVVLEAGSLSDYSGSDKSYNERIEVTYLGGYVREVGSESVLFSDDFTSPSFSYANWLRYEGDHNKPLASMQNNGFDADNFPWQFGMSDNESYNSLFAGSHSLYAPSGRSDDWMMTPQVLMPDDGKVILSFDAQGYMLNKKDSLKIYVFEEEFELSYLNDAWMKDVRERAELLDVVVPSAGESQETTDNEWTHYSYDLSKWLGKNIYVAFANQNYNQSALFIDNVRIERELLYTFGFSNANRVVDQDDIVIAGQFTVRTPEPVSSISLVLRDDKGDEVSTVSWPSVSGNIKDRPIPFSFSKPLPLKKGSENAYTIEVNLGDLQDVFRGTIADLTFEPTKRVVLEEMTGVTCQNCPLGILSIEKCKKAYGDRFIPISLHVYMNDPFASGMEPYAQFLGLNAAPSARINRLPKVYSPMHVAGDYYDTYPDDPVWYDVVSSELSKMTIADIDLKAVLSEDAKTVNYTADLRYALDATNQQLSLFVVILENGISFLQKNSYGMVESPVLGEWGAGGMYSAQYSKVMHDDIARLAVGQSFSGTLGLFPSTLEAGKVYSTQFSTAWPSSIASPDNASVVAMLIDSQSGQVVNAIRVQPTVGGDASAVADVEQAAPASADVYTLSGVRVMHGASGKNLNQLPAGIYVVGGKKVVVK